MKVIHETVESTIRKAINSAAEQNRKIEKVELEWWEANELSASLRSTLYIEKNGSFMQYGPRDFGKHVGAYMGVRLEIAPRV